MWIDRTRKAATKQKHVHGITNDFYQPQDLTLSLEVEERSTLVNQLLLSLGSKCQELLTRVIHQGLSMKEIAKELNYASEDSVKTTHYRCRKKMILAFKDRSDIKERLQHD